MKRFDFGKKEERGKNELSMVPFGRLDLGSFFDDFFSEPSGLGIFESFNKVPAIDVYEKDKKLVIKADLPGIDKKDINIRVHKDILTISAETNKEKKTEDEGCHYSERYSGRIQRSVRLPEGSETLNIKAAHSNGVLTVEIPMSEKAKDEGKDIEIR